jgi:arylsulfatase A-like enzyme
MDALDRLNLEKNTLLFVTSDNGPRIGVRGHKSAGKWRGYKSHIWEGGHRVPFIVRWPGEIKANTTSDEVICLTDLMATCAAIVGTNLPDNAGEDSYNILPALLGEKLEKPIRPDVIHHSVWGVFSIRQGKWKLILDTQGSGGWVEPSDKNPVPGTPGQLYDMEKDPYEKNNLWDKRPEVVERLTRLLEKYKKQGHSRPLHGK